MHPLPTIILTREPADNRAVATRMISEGYSVMEYPCIAVRMRPVGPGTDINPDIDRYQAVIFTSKRGVAGIGPIAGAIRKTPAQLIAIGSGTAQALYDTVGRNADMIPPDATGEATADALIAAYPPGSPMLYVRGNMTTGIMLAKLARAGMLVDDIIVYDNVAPHLQSLNIQEPVIALFASPSAARRFFGINDHLRHVTCVAIGPVTEAELKKLDIQRVYTAQNTDTDAIVECLLHVASQGETE